MRIADAPFVEGTGAKVLYDDIGNLGQLQEDLAALIAAQVEREASFIAIDGGMQKAHATLFAGEPGRDLAPDLAVGRLDLDHVRAEIGEHAPAHRAGPTGRSLKNANSVKRAGEIVTCVAVKI
jgi:hypothetical protein